MQPAPRHQTIQNLLALIVRHFLKRLIRTNDKLNFVARDACRIRDDAWPPYIFENFRSAFVFDCALSELLPTIKPFNSHFSAVGKNCNPRLWLGSQQRGDYRKS